MSGQGQIGTWERSRRQFDVRDIGAFDIAYVAEDKIL